MHFRSRRDGFVKKPQRAHWQLVALHVDERYRLLINEFPIRALDRSIRAYLLGMRSDLWVKFNIPPCYSINIRLKAASTCRLRIVKQQTRRHWNVVACLFKRRILSHTHTHTYTSLRDRWWFDLMLFLENENHLISRRESEALRESIEVRIVRREKIHSVPCSNARCLLLNRRIKK